MALALATGGIVIDSEMSGSMEDVGIADTGIIGKQLGVTIKTPQVRAGYVKGLYVKDCNPKSIYINNSGIKYNNDGDRIKIPPVLENFCLEGGPIVGYDYMYFTARDAIHIGNIENP
ncbi:MAG: hypothetical protein HUJ51_05415 [Eggerthellaceae bacterium]|nr:hypothetical protein [Eggerthellaceae bacterium]